MEVKFTPEHKVINDFFAREVKYIIPAYQRPYSWDCEGKSDRNNQVNSMWDDWYHHFLGSGNDTYFLGSMVLIKYRTQHPTIYTKTNLPITRELAALSHIDADFIASRHQGIVTSIVEDLGI